MCVCVVGGLEHCLQSRKSLKSCKSAPWNTLTALYGHAHLLKCKVETQEKTAIGMSSHHLLKVMCAEG